MNIVVSNERSLHLGAYNWKGAYSWGGGGGLITGVLITEVFNVGFYFVCPEERRVFLRAKLDENVEF